MILQCFVLNIAKINDIIKSLEGSVIMLKELTLDATVENITVVTEYIDEQLKKADCPLEIQYLIDIAVDELFGNIAKYGYKDCIGKVTVKMDIDEKKVIITFIDNGIPYNPLMREIPDLDLTAEEREPGGVGIHIVRTSMDDMKYEYTNNQNILTIYKKLI